MQQTWGKLKKVVVSSGLHVWSFKSCEEEEECWMMGWQVQFRGKERYLQTWHSTNEHRWEAPMTAYMNAKKGEKVGC